MDNKISYFEHEKDLTHMELKIKRLWVALLVSIIILGGSNIAWLILG